jgi:hypothetical protein
MSKKFKALARLYASTGLVIHRYDAKHSFFDKIDRYVQGISGKNYYLR